MSGKDLVAAHIGSAASVAYSWLSANDSVYVRKKCLRASLGLSRPSSVQHRSVSRRALHKFFQFIFENPQAIYAYLAMLASPEKLKNSHKTCKS